MSRKYDENQAKKNRGVLPSSTIKVESGKISETSLLSYSARRNRKDEVLLIAEITLSLPWREERKKIKVNNCYDATKLYRRTPQAPAS